MARRVPCKTPKCSNTVRAAESRLGICWPCLQARREQERRARAAQQPDKLLAEDRARIRRDAETTTLKQKYDESLKTIERLERDVRAINVLGKGVDTWRIAPKTGKHSSEGTAVLVASDWHIEENVGAEVGGLNRFNLEIAHTRATKFFQSGMRLVNLLHQDINITTIICALLGDFISNDIHEEFADVTELQPVHAIVAAQNMIISGIEFWLEQTATRNTEFVFVCHSGNHARTTKTTRFSSENGHSLEFMMYLHLAAYFRNQPRVKFIIPEGYHSYVNVYDTVIRFHHGHAVKYGGGVGGIYIPVNKAIAQWNKGKHADLDVFGHFHQLRDGGNFICNGSLIGYNAFALSIKADYEPPKQTLFLMDKKRGRTCVWPVFVTKPTGENR